VLRGKMTMDEADVTRAEQSTLRQVDALGAVQALFVFAYVALSYGLGPMSYAKQGVLFEGYARSSGFGRFLQDFVGGHTFPRPEQLVLAFGATAGGATLTFVLLLWRLSVARNQLSPRIATRLFRWATVFACAMALAAPVLVQDFYMSVAWGRMVVQGINPYYLGVPANLLTDLPLPELGLHMTYGPLWTVLSLITAALFKAVLVWAWLAAVQRLRGLVRARGAWQECYALAVLGWMPLTLFQILADGHNDVVMMFFVASWALYLSRRRFLAASLCLAAATAIKYIAAPLFVLDLVHQVLVEKQPLKRYVARGVVVAAGLVAVFAPFYRSPTFFGAVANMRSWHLYRPSDAVLAIEPVFGIHTWRLAGLVQAAFPLLALVYGVRYLRERDQSSLWVAALGILCAVELSFVGHVWPWFVIWPLSMAALVPELRLARWVVGLSVPATFMILMGCAYPKASDEVIHAIPTLSIYGFSVLWLWLVPSRWYPSQHDH
jgi:alpha-1,6-mannosyltransferase